MCLPWTGGGGFLRQNADRHEKGDGGELKTSRNVRRSSMDDALFHKCQTQAYMPNLVLNVITVGP